MPHDRPNGAILNDDAGRESSRGTLTSGLTGSWRESGRCA